MLDKSIRLWHTVRYLKPIQFYWRIWFRLVKPSVDLSTAPPVANTTARWVKGARKTSNLIGADGFSFLGVEGSLSELGWDGPQREKLWRYNQHYFDYLNAITETEQQPAVYDILESWLNDTRPGVGNAWEPYPTSLRIVNWIKWSLIGNELPEGFNASLAVQARWLMKRLEFHLLGNHLFANAKALVFVGLYFEGPEARIWLKKGLSIIELQLSEQILTDGGHFERSTMYHAIVFEDLLDLCNIANCCSRSENDYLLKAAMGWKTRLPGMHIWLKNMSHPDSAISFFNDAAIGIAPAWSELDGYYTRIMAGDTDENDSLKATPINACYGIWTNVGQDIRYVHMSESGYLKVEARDMVAILDIAPVGPDYLPGHAHADTLSFELSLGTQRIFVNSGTSCYGSSPERLRQRGTAAHNTVVIDAENSSEVWGGFRVARRAYVDKVKIEDNVNAHHKNEPVSLTISAEHDGYTRLDGKPIHSRFWSFFESAISVSDFISGQFGTAEAYYHLHPDVKIHESDDPSEFRLDYGSGECAFISIETGLARVIRSTWHPGFGETIPNQCLVIQFTGSQSKLVLTI